MAFRSKYTGAQIESLLDKVNDMPETTIKIDDHLSGTSVNAVENKVVTKAFEQVNIDVSGLQQDIDSNSDSIEQLSGMVEKLEDRVNEVEDKNIIWNEVV